MHDSTENLIFPRLAPLYSALTPLAEALMRVVAGGLLLMHGLPKLMSPFGAGGMVESIGFSPGFFWSPLLSVAEPVAGLLLLIGLWTRPAAIVASIILLVTAYAHGIAWGEGLMGAEKSIFWMLITLYFAARGAGKFSVDRAMGKQF